MARVEWVEFKLDDEVKMVFLKLTPEFKETLLLKNFPYIFEQVTIKPKVVSPC